MSYTNNNITFTTFDGNIFPRIKKVGNNENIGATVDDLTEIASDNGGKLPTIINALEIDWNGAEVQLNGDTAYRTITNTGELLGDIINNGSPMWAN